MLLTPVSKMKREPSTKLIAMRTTRPSQSGHLRPKNWSISQLPGLHPEDQDKLIQHGITSTLQLFHVTQTSAQRQQLATQLQTHIQHINKWAALANLARVPSVGCQHCGLLLHAGIISPEQLGQMSLPRLHQQILKLQVAMFQQRDLCPSLNEVSEWIQQARLISQSASRP